MQPYSFNLKNVRYLDKTTSPYMGTALILALHQIQCPAQKHIAGVSLRFVNRFPCFENQADRHPLILNLHPSLSSVCNVEQPTSLPFIRTKESSPRIFVYARVMLRTPREPSRSTSNLRSRCARSTDSSQTSPSFTSVAGGNRVIHLLVAFKRRTLFDSSWTEPTCPIGRLMPLSALSSCSIPSL